jgi:ubiquinone/menaquinone biosynthesis C-methylase UbiE
MRLPPDLSVYRLGVDDGEHLRLLEQAQYLRPAAESLLNNFRGQHWQRTIDIACGPFGILDLLLERTAGLVVGLDRETWTNGLLDQWRGYIGQSNVSAIRADAGAIAFQSASFDFAHARLLLTHLPDPVTALAEMTRITRPGGTVACQDVDLSTWRCEPALPEWDALVAELAKMGNTKIGGLLDDLLTSVGLIDVQSTVINIEAPVGSAARNLLVNFVMLFREDIIRNGSLTADALDTCLRRVREHCAFAETYVQFAPLTQAWGRRPEQAQLAQPIPLRTELDDLASSRS